MCLSNPQRSAASRYIMCRGPAWAHPNTHLPAQSSTLRRRGGRVGVGQCAWNSVPRMCCRRVYDIRRRASSQPCVCVRKPRQLCWPTSCGVPGIGHECCVWQTSDERPPARQLESSSESLQHSQRQRQLPLDCCIRHRYRHWPTDRWRVLTHAIEGWSVLARHPPRMVRQAY